MRGKDKTTHTMEWVELVDGAITVSEQQYLQGDAEAVFGKRIIYVFESDTDSHFTSVTAQYVLENENITGLTWQKFVIRFIKAMNDEAHSCYLHIYAQDDNNNTDPDLDDQIGMVPLDFSASPTYRVGNGATYAHYRLDVGRNNDLWFPYEDEDGTYEFHVSWEDLNAAGKAGGADSIKIKVYAEVVA